MAEYLIQGETLTGIADAIRGKTGGTEPVAVSDMAAQIEGIEAGGGDDVLNALIDGSITEISSNATSIGNFAFSTRSGLTAADFPAATIVGNRAFNQCSNLTTVNFPSATIVGDYVFYSCSSLTTVNFPSATSIGNYAFQSCSSLTTVNFPSATSIGDNVFQSCSSLTTVDFHVATSIGKYAFYYCFDLTTVDIRVATSIGRGVFMSCTALKALILRSETMSTLENTDAFSNTAIINGTGYIYVPSSLIEQYKVATNWSTYAAQFRALEDYTVDGTVTGELDESKI